MLVKLSALLVVMVALAGCGSSGPNTTKQSEKQAAATGDIPDNQVFLTYRGTGYSLKYPEGWTRTGGSANLTFRDKGNSVHLALSRGSAPAGRRRIVTRGVPDPVTGKRPVLIVDRYTYSKGGRVATLDLSTPKGVDNVDAYRLISRSFKWV
jgi:predicted small lipoprotein YifL